MCFLKTENQGFFCLFFPKEVKAEIQSTDELKRLSEHMLNGRISKKDVVELTER